MDVDLRMAVSALLLWKYLCERERKTHTDTSGLEENGDGEAARDTSPFTIHLAHWTDRL